MPGDSYVEDMKGSRTVPNPSKGIHKAMNKRTYNEIGKRIEGSISKRISTSFSKRNKSPISKRIDNSISRTDSPVSRRIVANNEVLDGYKDIEISRTGTSSRADMSRYNFADKNGVLRYHKASKGTGEGKFTNDRSIHREGGGATNKQSKGNTGVTRHTEANSVSSGVAVAHFGLDTTTQMSVTPRQQILALVNQFPEESDISSESAIYKYPTTVKPIEKTITSKSRFTTKLPRIISSERNPPGVLSTNQIGNEIRNFGQNVKTAKSYVEKHKSKTINKSVNLVHANVQNQVGRNRNKIQNSPRRTPAGRLQPSGMSVTSKSQRQSQQSKYTRDRVISTSNQHGYSKPIGVKPKNKLLPRDVLIYPQEVITSPRQPIGAKLTSARQRMRTKLTSPRQPMRGQHRQLQKVMFPWRQQGTSNYGEPSSSEVEVVPIIVAKHNKQTLAPVSTRPQITVPQDLFVTETENSDIDYDLFDHDISHSPDHLVAIKPHAKSYRDKLRNDLHLKQDIGNGMVQSDPLPSGHADRYSRTSQYALSDRTSNSYNYENREQSRLPVKRQEFPRRVNYQNEVLSRNQATQRHQRQHSANEQRGIPYNLLFGEPLRQSFQCDVFFFIIRPSLMFNLENSEVSLILANINNPFFLLRRPTHVSRPVSSP